MNTRDTIIHQAGSVQDNTIDAIAKRLHDAAQRHLGTNCQIENLTLATLGGSNRTILFDLVEGNTRRRLVSRQETYTLDESPFLPPEIQYRLLQLTFAHDIPVPEPIFEFEPDDELGRGHVVACVEGETLPKTLLTASQYQAARERFAAQCGAILARLHAIDCDQADFLAPFPDTQDPIAAQLARYDYYAEPHPALDFGFRWLQQRRPTLDNRCLVHGDFRLGNMIVNESGIQAVLDWECALLGDPMGDLGWLCTRAWRFGRNDKPVAGMDARETLFAAYEAAGGMKVDRERVRWWEIFGSLRWAMLNIMQVHGHLSGVRRSPAFAACGRNTCLMEYDLLLTIAGQID